MAKIKGTILNDSQGLGVTGIFTLLQDVKSLWKKSVGGRLKRDRYISTHN